MTSAAQTRPARRPRPQPSRKVSRGDLARLIAERLQTLGEPDLRRLAADLRIVGPNGAALPVEPRAAKRARGDKKGQVGRPAASAGDVRELSGGGVGPLVGVEEGQAGLDAVTVEDLSSDWASSELLGAGGTAARLAVARATLDNWRRAGKAIAFRKGLRNYLYPVRQFERFGPVEGLDRVLPHFASTEDAWEWLVTPNRSTSGEPPIERLRARRADEVARAAEGALDYA